MKWLFIPAAAAFSLAVAFPALATPQAGAKPASERSSVYGAAPAYLQFAQADQDKKKRGRRSQQGGQQGSQGQGLQAGPRRSGNPDMRDLRQQRGQDRRDFRQERRQDRRDFRQDLRQDRRDFRQERRQDRRDFRQDRHNRFDWNNYRPGHRPPDWERHRRFDRNQWQRDFRARERYRWHRYHRPHGWYYQRWTFGMILPSLFWSRDYWINDYWQFGLDDPPYGYVWVRYGDDAVLVDVESGRILRVVYDLYY